VAGIWLVSDVAMWILLLALAFAMGSAMRNVDLVHRRLRLMMPAEHRLPTGLKSGQTMPEVTFRTIDGQLQPLSALIGQRHAITMVSPRCQACPAALGRLAESPDPLDSTVTRRVVISLGDAESTRQLLNEVGLDESTTVWLDRDRLTVRSWGMTEVPVTVVVDENLQVVRQLFWPGSAIGSASDLPGVRACAERVPTVLVPR